MGGGADTIYDPEQQQQQVQETVGRPDDTGISDAAWPAIATISVGLFGFLGVVVPVLLSQRRARNKRKN